MRKLIILTVQCCFAIWCSYVRATLIYSFLHCKYYRTTKVCWELITSSVHLVFYVLSCTIKLVSCSQIHRFLSMVGDKWSAVSQAKRLDSKGWRKFHAFLLVMFIMCLDIVDLAYVLGGAQSTAKRKDRVCARGARGAREEGKKDRKDNPSSNSAYTSRSHAPDFTFRTPAL